MQVFFSLFTVLGLDCWLCAWNMAFKSFDAAASQAAEVTERKRRIN